MEVISVSGIPNPADSTNDVGSGSDEPSDLPTEDVLQRSRCRGNRSADLFGCSQPLECTREACFPDEIWADVTNQYYDRRTGHLRG